MTESRDTVTLEIPRERAFIPILHMVLGGIGLRRNLSFDALDDMQLAVDSVLDGDPADGASTLTMRVDLGADEIAIDIDGLRDPDLRATLEDGKVPAGAEKRCLDVCILLRSLVDGYEVRDLEDPRYGVTLRKSV